MRYVRVTIRHHPDAGQHSTSHFSYPDRLGHSDEATARDFAFKALGESNVQKGFVSVDFPERVTYSFRFERMGLMGYNLTQTQECLVEGRAV